MTLTSLLIFAAALAVAAGSPGPSIAALVARVLSRGARDVLPFLAAMWVGEAIWLSLAVWGLSAIAHGMQPLFAAIRWAGVAYLLYLAWKMWRAPAETDDAALPSRAEPWRMFAAGFAVTLGNPKIMLFYLALVPTILDLARLDVGGWAELTLTMTAVLIAVDLSWVLLASRARRLLRSPRAIRATNRGSAVVMAGAASLIAAKG
ncbi:LysE family translocator [Acidimangrovimonas sediminis]|uniref:LysE family translocator n=1 Tax=Acidimangrovimonas sediminis TaxID=2056283 RepID=UPI000C801B56|nr:LysE family translocator [Acidimangrovimonas sediminis]